MKKKTALFITLVIIVIIATPIFMRYRNTRGELGFCRAKKFYEENRYDESYLAFASLLKQYKKAIWLGEATYYAAKSLSLLGRDGEAVEYWQRLKKLYGNGKYGDETSFYIGRSYEKEGKLEEAKLHYESLMNDFPESVFVDEALFGLGRIYERESNLEDAIASFQKVAKNSPESQKIAESILGIAAVYEKRELWEKGLNLYQKVLMDCPDGVLAEKAEEGIGRINTRLIFSFYPADDSFIYKVEKGDSLASISKKFNTTIELIKEANRLASTMIKPGQRFKITKSNFSILVRKGKNKLYLKNNEKLVRVYKVATGKDNSTPEGRFTIINRLESPTWYTAGAIFPPESPENILGSRWLGLSEKGYGIHGTDSPDDIGKYVTNGCIRLLEQDIQELYKLVPAGTNVEITK